MIDDILINKSQIIARCIQRVNEEYESDPKNLEDFRRQDSIILNLQRLCEASINIATHLIRKRRLGVPQSSKDAFAILEKADLIPKDLSQRLQAMVGFRNIAVHECQSLNLNIVQVIGEQHMYDGLELVKIINHLIHDDSGV